MSISALIVKDGNEQHRMLITDRDWGLLWGPLFVAGPIFSMSFGVYDNFTMSSGVPEGSRVVRKGRNLFNAAQVLLVAIERDLDLLEFDYSYSFVNEAQRYSDGQTVHVRGRSGILRTRPKGYCFIELGDSGPKGGRIAELIDLRIIRELDTDDSRVIKIHRRRAKVLWLETLPQLVEFLRQRIGKELVVEHVDRVA
jgi:hypothetical protein